MNKIVDYHINDYIGLRRVVKVLAIITLVLIVMILTQGCAVDYYAGMSFNDTKGGYPEINGLAAPLGIIRAEYRTNYDSQLFCEHISSISESEQGTGLNHCGFILKLR